MEERRASQRVSSRTDGTGGRAEVDEDPAEGEETLSEASPEGEPLAPAGALTRGGVWLVMIADVATLPGLASKVGPTLPLPVPLPPCVEGEGAAPAVVPKPLDA